MGDRCYLEMTYRKDDHAAVQKLFGYDQEQDWYDDVVVQNDTWLHVTLGEANYGLMSAREQIALDGVAFFGWHSSGGDYEACVFASADGELADVIGVAECPHVGLNEDGSTRHKELKNGMRYYEILRKAKEKVYMKINGFYSASPDLSD